MPDKHGRTITNTTRNNIDCVWTKIFAVIYFAMLESYEHPPPRQEVIATDLNVVGNDSQLRAVTDLTETIPP
ncbi:MAG: hypothetical protein IKP64_06025 [Selenomonadaceae bacterium]|nr:hypothetical protein [Selenomonadaceae bacterium]